MLDLAFAMAPPPEGAEQGPGGFLAMFPPLIMMGLIFYFVLIRPQQKKHQEQRNMLDSLKEGDNVITLSGIHGTVRKLKDDVVTLQIAENVRIKINRASIGVRRTEGPGKESDEPEKEKDDDKQAQAKDKKDNKKKKGKSKG